MIPLDELVPHYRRARDRWFQAPTLVAHYHTLAEAYEGTGQALLETVKSFIECVCRTIIADFGGTMVAGDPSTTELLVAALEHLGLRNTRGASKFDRVLSAHNKLADALNECRNHDGPLAHGKDGFIDALAEHHVRMYLLTGDTILSLLLGALTGKQPDLNHTREPYERFAHFNSAIDRNIGTAASVDLDNGLVVLQFKTHGLPDGLELHVEPSRLLYQLDRAAFVEVLDSLPSALFLDADVPSATISESGPGLEGPPGRDILAAKLVAAYNGPLRTLRHDLETEIATLGTNIPAGAQPKLVPSLLRAFETAAGLDWSKRSALRARVLLNFKRVLRAAGARRTIQDDMAARLVDWFASKRPTGAEE